MSIFRYITLRVWYIFVLIRLVFGQTILEPSTDSVYALHVDLLPLGDKVKSSGQKLISQSYGFTRIENKLGYNKKVLLVAVHGFKSEGYEWVASLVQLSEIYSYTIFYRYNWDICPDVVAQELTNSLNELVRQSPGIEKLVLFGHCYGGLVVTFCASQLHLNIPIEIHTIASPLAGYKRLFTKCEINRGIDGSVTFPSWAPNITLVQWRTQHRLDNAFKKFREDPQEINLSGCKVFRLPATLDGHRLGHNWSVTWVMDEYLGIPHKP